MAVSDEKNTDTAQSTNWTLYFGFHFWIEIKTTVDYIANKPKNSIFTSVLNLINR